MSPDLNVAGLQLVGLEHLKKRAGWFIALGVLLVLLGAVAVGSPFYMTVFSVIFIGWLLIFGGAMQTVHAFSCKRWSGFFLDLLTGLLYLLVGFEMVANPAASAEALTLLIAGFLMFGGVFRIVASFSVRYQHWVWLFLYGLVDLVLGIMIWRQWPVSGLWVIGLFVGIDMIFNGWTLIMLGATARNLPAAEPAR